MAESDWHRELMNNCIEALLAFFAERDDVYIAGNNFLYYQQGDPTAAVSPDCYVVFGASRGKRNSYKVWRENNLLPGVVIEITSKKTRRADTTTKYTLYEQVLRVPEYILFDPDGDYLNPNLTGYRLGANGYEPMPRDSEERLHSQTLELVLFQEGRAVRFFDPASNEVFLSYFESRQRTRAEARLAQALAEIEALRKQI